MGKNSASALGIVFIIASIILSGCIGSQYSGKCSQYDNSYEHDDCMNYMAVWYQDPYTCYGISRLELRGECLNNSINPEAAQKLKVEKKNEERKTVVEEQKEEQVLVENVDLDSVSTCMLNLKISKEACMQKIAIETLDMSLCNKIGVDEYRKPCISNVAITKKDSSVCSQLDSSDDALLCKYYSGG
jgi:hypothetical protein